MKRDIRSVRNEVGTKDISRSTVISASFMLSYAKLLVARCVVQSRAKARSVWDVVGLTLLRCVCSAAGLPPHSVAVHVAGMADHDPRQVIFEAPMMPVVIIVIGSLVTTVNA